MERVKYGRLEVAKVIVDLLQDEILPGTGFDANEFWQGLESLIQEFSGRNRELLAVRERMQTAIDDWHLKNRGKPFDQEAYGRFLKEIGYLVEEGEPFKVSTEGVDPEIATIAGPQLVVPVMNARFALNAANARWGSLYDALYGSDIISDAGGAEQGKEYNPLRGQKVVAYVQAFLNRVLPLKEGLYQDVTAFMVGEGEVGLQMRLANGQLTQLADDQAFCGYRGVSTAPSAVLLKHHHLHIEIQIDRAHVVGKASLSGVKDVIMESAVTTIQDCEDSVAAVDAEDKALVYRNWLGLIKGTLEDTFHKNGQPMTRKLNPDRSYTGRDGKQLLLPGRSLLLVRNVGHLMTTDAVLMDGEEVFEGLLDAMFTAAAALHNLKGSASLMNSRTGSIYIVKPKMHGPDEVAFSVAVMAQVEHILGLKKNTIKIGIMDEERRTTVNLSECIRQARERVIFINTGFLDRTGDEIHTSMEAGPVVPKQAMKQQPWMQAYEDWNVDVGLACGLRGVAQIGKGMWAKPDEMAEMMVTKQAHPQSGANCAWVPSPTAATLHALHYHDVSVGDVQAQLLENRRARLGDILKLPLLADPGSLTPKQISEELENNAQGILGYVVRWVDQGVGCSKVPDIHNTALMEDRATLRISSQHMANWLHHGIVSKEQVVAVMQKMAKVVDGQNAHDPDYRPMAAGYDDSLAFQAALDLVLTGRKQPSGYTEPVLHQRRRQVKALHRDKENK